MKSMLAVAAALVAVVVGLGMVTGRWAGGGWYLMAPPRTSDERTPLSTWKQRAAFGDADRCEGTRVAWNKQAEKRMAENRTPINDDNIDNLLVLLATQEDLLAARSAVCISSDDPRLRP